MGISCSVKRLSKVARSILFVRDLEAIIDLYNFHGVCSLNVAIAVTVAGVGLRGSGVSVGVGVGVGIGVVAIVDIVIAAIVVTI